MFGWFGGGNMVCGFILLGRLVVGFWWSREQGKVDSGCLCLCWHYCELLELARLASMPATAWPSKAGRTTLQQLYDRGSSKQRGGMQTMKTITPQHVETESIYDTVNL